MGLAIQLKNLHASTDSKPHRRLHVRVLPYWDFLVYREEHLQ